MSGLLLNRSIIGASYQTNQLRRIKRINDLQDYIAQQTTQLTEFDESLVRRWIKQIIIWDNHITVELMSTEQIKEELICRKGTAITSLGSIFGNRKHCFNALPKENTPVPFLKCKAFTRKDTKTLHFGNLRLLETPCFFCLLRLFSRHELKSGVSIDVDA